MGSLRRTANGKEIDPVQVVATSKLEDVLNYLERKYEMEIRRDSTLILVNGVEARALEGFESLITSGDEIVLIPMFHGG